MVVLMVDVVMAMGVRMTGAVGMLMFVFVEHDLQPSAECLGDPAEGGKARDVIAALQARDHGLGHLETRSQPLLRFAGMSAELDQPPRALGSDRRAVVLYTAMRRWVVWSPHG